MASVSCSTAAVSILSALKEKKEKSQSTGRLISSCVLTGVLVNQRKVILLGILKMVPVSLRRSDRNVMTLCE